MATKRKPIHSNFGSSKLNFRPMSQESQKQDGKGTKPVPEQSSIANVLLMMVIHTCRKIVFVDTIKRVAVYCACLFLVSLIGDVMPIPRSYFSRSDNLLNQCFVKFGWGWTMIVTFPFLVLTSYTVCCGRRDKVLQHLVRLCVATASWFFWTKLFEYIEVNYGKCSAKGDYTKQQCLTNGQYWHSFHISGHAFILVYSSLILIEEARAIIGWERIRDLIREEYHIRSTSEDSRSITVLSPLGGLSESEFIILKSCYERFTPLVRTLFILMTFFSMLWDFMLIFTMLYFHNMVEKLLAGVIAIFIWFVTYRGWYTTPKLLPDLPGEGLFRYKGKEPADISPKKRRSVSSLNSSKGQLPRFMGMPLYGLRSQDGDKSDGINNGVNTLSDY
ncbi:hypothetical protein ONE63_006153 [Megalurothrips usitatus]|uniref:Fat storage-inducing transmembrane protein n=1 Tax=Megalurothrips usitatus TaxID=439358 RepID=A0AAV7XXE4_9NEOP|nr:hypothetical protein ONE63_006153 [Megalurothrips usitatus]